MSSNATPVVLGGDPVRPHGTFRTTPEVGQRELDFVGVQLLSGVWQADPTPGDIPVATGLELPINVRKVLGWEAAALAAELGDLQAPGQWSNVVPCNNGTQAIKLVLASLDKWSSEFHLRPFEVGSEVLVPALTWQATAGAVLRRNMVPVLVDVLPGTFCMDPEAAAAAITDRTVAIIPVHLYDRMAEMDKIMQIAAAHQLAVIEDCAHAHGARYRGQGAGTIGHCGTFSDQGSKSLSCQEGGFLTPYRLELADQLCSAVTCGRQVGVSKSLQSDNDRMPLAIAALLRSQLRRFPEQNELRLRVGEQFDSIVRTELGYLGLTVNDPQDGVEVPPTYKKGVRIDRDFWGGLTLRQWMVAMEAELNCEFATVYEPLTDSPYYAPNSDSALRISGEYWARIDPAAYKAPVAQDIFASTAMIEHAAFLDEHFPALFVEAAQKIQGNVGRLVRGLKA